MQTPSHLLPWLTYEGFLTKKLHHVTGDTSLEILAQSWSHPSWWDCYMLGVHEMRVWRREILMHALDEPCWYARTLIPGTTFDACPAWFDGLKTQILGQLIFERHDVERVSLQHYPLDPSLLEYHWLHQDLHQKKPLLWARLSEFLLHGRFPFFLSEIFLPGLERYIV